MNFTQITFLVWLTCFLLISGVRRLNMRLRKRAIPWGKDEWLDSAAGAAAMTFVLWVVLLFFARPSM